MLTRLVICFAIGIANGIYIPQDLLDAGNRCNFTLEVDTNATFQNYNSTQNLSALTAQGTFTGNNFYNRRIHGQNVDHYTITMSGTIKGTTISAEKNISCVLLQGRRVENNDVTANRVFKTDFRASETINDNVVQGTSLNQIHFVGEIGSILERNHLRGDSIDRVFMMGSNISDTTVQGLQVRQITLAPYTLLSNTYINATECIDEVNTQMKDFYSGLMDRTHLYANCIDGVVFEARTINETRIYGERFVKRTIVDGYGSVLGAHIETKGLMSDVYINGRDIRDLKITADTGMKNVTIKAEDDVRDIFINGILADDIVYPPNRNFTIGSIELHCDDTNGHANQTGSEGSCVADQCSTTCIAKQYRRGDCYKQTCCCLIYLERLDFAFGSSYPDFH